MLGQRIVTALVLLALFLAALSADSPLAFVALTVAMIGAAGWEWARLNGAGKASAVGYGLALAAACGWAAGNPSHADALRPLWWMATVLWVLGGAWILRGGPSAWHGLPGALRWLLGLLLLALAWLAMVTAHSVGVNFLLSILCIVWMADIAAYFGGRAFGRRKLAPSISPGKSWAGVYSGVAGVVLLGAAWLAIDRLWPTPSSSVFTVLYRSLGTVGWVLSMVCLAALSVVGDLFESLVKRAAGAKDSSALLPGHGGVLDRIDALLPVLPAAMALAAL